MTDFTQRWNRRARLIAIVALGVLAAGWLPAAVYADDDDDDNRSWSTTTLRISEARWTASEGRLTVRGRGARDETTVTVKNAATGAVLDTDRSNDDGEWRVTVRNPSPVPTRVRVESYRRTAAEAAVQGAPTTPPPPPPAVTLTGLAIAGPTSVNEGATATYTATATYSNSTTKAVAATFTATGSATISGGTLTAAQVTGNGAATVNASYTEGGVTRTATRAVTIVDTTPPPPVVTLTALAINGPTSVNEGATATYTATATYSNSTTKAVAAAFTATGNATISGGTLTAAQVTGNGAATVNASYTEGGVTRTATRAVTIVDTTPPPPVVTLTALAINGPTSVNEGATAAYTATATYSDSTSKAVAATFTATGNATISGGTLTAAQVTGNGSATVNASYTEGGVTRTATRAVTIVDTTPPPPVVTLTALAIAGPTSVNEGATATYTATATYSNSTTKAVTATYTVTGNATMSGATLTAAQVTANGSATVTASYTEGGVTRTATRNVTIVNVAATLTSLAISGPVTVNEGATGAFTATATYSDATTRTVTPTYTVTGPGTMAAGTFTAGQVTGNGTATINASYTEGGVTRTASRSVTILDLTALSGLTINGPATAAEGTTATYTATASYTNAASKTVTPTWSVTGPATITTAGILTAGQVTGNQSAALTASYTEGGVTRTATANLSITDSVTPPPPGTGSHASRVTAFTGTATCLACHRDRALEVHASAHYQFKGATPDVPNLAGARQGKMGGINDFCIYPDINWIGKLTNVSGQQVDGGCGRCHAGLGDKPVDTASPTDAHLQNIDCLVCHSSAYKRTVAMVGTTYKFVPDTANMSVTLLAAAQDLKRPDRGICLNCHSKAGGGNNFKRGDLEEAHREPPTRAFDVHMSSTALGGGGLVCTSCHTTANHRISGRGVDLRETDNAAKPSCTNCHPARPHNNADRDKHVGRVHCTTCHIPTFAKIAPTDMERDWSVPGDLDVAKGLYDPHMVKQANVIPEYKFWNGQSYIYNFGTAATLDASGRVSMAKPLGSITTTGSKIYPFKHHLGKQPKETTSQRLLPLKIGIFFSTNDFQQAVEQGAIGVGWGYSGHDFALTERYLGLYHEVSPKEQALTCNNCHTAPKRLPLADLGYTPFTTVGGRALCSSCHGSESYPAATRFTQVHSRHVNSERLNCNRCHGFSTGPTQ